MRGEPSRSCSGQPALRYLRPSPACSLHTAQVASSAVPGRDVMARFPQAVDAIDQNQGTLGFFDNIRCTPLPLYVVTGHHCAVTGFLGGVPLAITRSSLRLSSNVRASCFPGLL